jgi:hypothetical protein
MTLAASAIAGSRASPSSSIAMAVPSVPAATRRSGPSLSFSHGSRRGV